jgi:hypothetical protein
LEERALAVHGAGSTLFVEGLVDVECDLEKPLFRINGDKTSATSVAALAGEVTEIVAPLRKDARTPDATLRLLLEAYRAALGGTGRPVGSQVDTDEVLYQAALLQQSPSFRTDPTARAFKDYGRVAFRRDLYVMLEAGHVEVDGLRFRHAPGSTKRGALFMLVPALGRPSHLGRIWFEERGN